MTLLEIAALSDAQLNELSETVPLESSVARFVREEHVMRQLSGVARSILTDIFTSPDAYDLSFDEIHMLSRYLVNMEARETYRNSGGEISPEMATELRLSFYDEQSITRFVDGVYESMAAGVERPLAPDGFMQMAVRVGTNLFMLSDFESINKELEAVGSRLRYTGTQPQQSSPFLFVLFVTPPNRSVFSEIFEPNGLLDFERQFLARHVSDDEDERSLYLSDKKRQFDDTRFLEIYSELVRSPALPPDINGVNFQAGRYRYINVWSEPLSREFFS